MKHHRFSSHQGLEKRACFGGSIWLGLIVLWAPLAGFAHPGEIDLSFNTGSFGAQDSSGKLAEILAAALQTDGKIVLAGRFTRFNNRSRNYIVRLNGDGSVDGTFTFSLNAAASALAILRNGQILVAAVEDPVAADRSIARLNANGSLDETFAVRLSGPRGFGPLMNEILELGNGRLVIAGSFTNVNETARSRICVLNSNGSLDNSFQPGSGLEDGFATVVDLQLDGKLLVGGTFSRAGGQPRERLARFNLNGTLDPDFAPAFFDPNSSPPGAIHDIRISGDGRILVGGYFTTVNGEKHSTLARLNSNGSLDAGFAVPFELFPAGPGLASISGMEFQKDGKLLVTGRIQINDSGVAYQSIVRLNADGTLDRGFYAGPGIGVDSAKILAQPNGAILLAGVFTEFRGSPLSGVVRLQGGDATLPRVIADPISQTQPAGSRVTLSAIVFGVEPLSYQWSRNGLPIPGATGATLILNDLRGVQAGDYTLKARNLRGEVTTKPATVIVIAAPGSPGSVDASFNPQFNGPIVALALGSDGKIVIGGSFTAVDGLPRKGLARLHPDGTLDQGFAPSVSATNLLGVALLRDQRVLVQTSAYPYSTVPNAVLAFSPSGAVEAILDVERLLTSAGLNVAATEAELYLPGDGTPVLHCHTHPNYGPVKIADFALRIEGNVLAATATTLPTEALQIRQSSGKMITTETEYLGYRRPVSYILLRRLEDGMIDGSFRIALGAVTKPRIAIDRDRLLVAFTPVVDGFSPPPQYPRLRRYAAGGTEDPSFPPIVFGRPVQPTAEAITAVVIQPGQKVLVAGAFQSGGNVSRNYLARINLGEPEVTTPSSIIDQPESLDVVTGQTARFTVNPDGTGPLAYQWLFRGQAMAGQTNRALILTNVSATAEGDYLVEVNGSVRSLPARLTVAPAPGGSVDPAFDPGSGADDGAVKTLLREPDGRLLVGGTFTRFNGAPRKGLVRLNADGSIDPTFEAGRINAGADPVAKLTVDALARHADGRIVFGGTLQQTGGAARTNVFRLHPNGIIDPAFLASPGHAPTLMSLAVLEDNRVLVGGTFNYTNKMVELSSIENFRNLVRLTPDGNLDQSFKPQVNATQSGFTPFGPWFLPGNIRAIAPFDSEKVLVAGAFEPKSLESSFALLNSDGTRDIAFEPRICSVTDEIGRGGVPSISAMALLGNGDSVIGGNFLVAGRSSGLARFTQRGHLTGLLPDTPDPAANALAFQADRKTIVGGLFNTLRGASRTNLARLHKDGSIDVSFGSAAQGPNGAVSAIVVEPSGAILIGGNFTAVDGVPRRGIARLYGSGRVYRELLRPRVQESKFSAAIQTLAGKRYILESSDTLSAPTWSATATLDGDGSLKTISDLAPGSSQRFYRVRIE